MLCSNKYLLRLKLHFTCFCNIYLKGLSMENNLCDIIYHNLYSHHGLYGRLEVVSMQAIFTCIPAINQCVFSDALIQWYFFSGSCPHERRRRGLQATVGEPSDHLLLCSTHCDSWFYCSHILSSSHIDKEWLNHQIVVSCLTSVSHHQLMTWLKW